MEEQYEEPTLPTLSIYSSDIDLDDANSQTFPSAKRKRSSQCNIFSDSSEPAVFSSDNDPAAENYIQGPRQKKQYRGTWDQQQPLDSLPEGSSTRSGDIRRKLQPVDSGVFMGSSDSMDEDPDLLPPTTSTLRWRSLTAPTLHIRGETDHSLRLALPEGEALRKIQKCIDEGNQAEQRVDLS